MPSTHQDGGVFGLDQARAIDHAGDLPVSGLISMIESEYQTFV